MKNLKKRAAAPVIPLSLGLWSLSVDGETVSETITETTKTETYWEEEFSGTREETEKWKAGKEKEKEEKERAQEGNKQNEQQETIVITETVTEEPQTELIIEEEAVLEEQEREEEEVFRQSVAEPADVSAAETEETADETLPEIRIENVAPFTAARVSVKPKIIISDDAINESAVKIMLKRNEEEKNNVPADLKRTGTGLIYEMEAVEEDGKYLLQVEAVDEAGNRSVLKRIFTVNKSGTRFIYDEKRYVEEEEVYSPRIRVENCDVVRILSCMVNGKEAKYSWEGDEIVIESKCIGTGRSVITIETKDSAGNLSSMKPWEIIRIDRREINGIL